MAAYANRSVREKRLTPATEGMTSMMPSTVCVKCSVREGRCLSGRSSV